MRVHGSSSTEVFKTDGTPTGHQKHRQTITLWNGLKEETKKVQ